MTTPGNAPTLTRQLCLGSSGSPVRALQALLNGSQLALGPTLVVDGRFGKMTHIAVIAFQRRKGLKVDGVVGPKTANALGWHYRPVNEKPYIVSYEKPPLPAATPPLTVVSEAIRAGMDQFKEKLADDFWVVFNDPNNDPYYQRLMGKVHAEDPSMSTKQNQQLILRIKDLIFHYKRFSEVLSQLGDLSASEPENVPARLRAALKEFISQMIRACDAMSFYYGITEHCRKRLNSLPVESIVGKVEGVLKGDRAVHFAVAEIQMLFQTIDYAGAFNRTKVIDRPTLDWLERFEYHFKPNIP